MNPIGIFLLRLTLPKDQGGITRAQVQRFLHSIDERNKGNTSITTEQMVAFYQLLTLSEERRITEAGLEAFLENPSHSENDKNHFPDNHEDPTPEQIQQLLEMINRAPPLSPILPSDLDAFLKDPSMGELEVGDPCELPTRKQITEVAARCKTRIPPVVVHQRNFQAWLDTYRCRFSTGGEPKNTFSFEVDYGQSIGDIIQGREIEWKLESRHHYHNVFNPMGLHWHPGNSRPRSGTIPPKPSIEDFIGLWAEIKHNPVEEKYTVEADYIYFLRHFSITQMRSDLCNGVQKYGWRPMTVFEVLTARSEIPIIAFASRSFDGTEFIQASIKSINCVDLAYDPRLESRFGIVRIGQNPIGDKEWELVSSKK